MRRGFGAFEKRQLRMLGKGERVRALAVLGAGKGRKELSATLAHRP